MPVRVRTLLLTLVAFVALGLIAGFVYYALDRGSSPPPPSLPQAARPTVITDGRWRVRPGAGTFAGYRVREEYASVGVRTAVGRTPAVSGSVQVAGGRLVAAELTADMTRVRSDKPQRDDTLRSRGIETDRYPRARFALSAPAALAKAGIPAAGLLELHGRRAPVTLRVAAGGLNGELVLAGAAGVRFVDFGIAAPSVAGLVTVRDHGTLEFRLVLVRER
jgi:polyisoprenoid-binding protein YceI